MSKIYTDEVEFLTNPAVKEFAKSLRKLYNEIPFTNLSINHHEEFITAQYFAQPPRKIKTADYFYININMGDEHVIITMDTDLPEEI